MIGFGVKRVSFFRGCQAKYNRYSTDVEASNRRVWDLKDDQNDKGTRFELLCSDPNWKACRRYHVIGPLWTHPVSVELFQKTITYGVRKINLNRTVRDDYTNFIAERSSSLELTVLSMPGVEIYANLLKEWWMFLNRQHVSSSWDLKVISLARYKTSYYKINVTPHYLRETYMLVTV
jgi:hypothetical protein